MVRRVVESDSENEEQIKIEIKEQIEYSDSSENEIVQSQTRKPTKKDRTEAYIASQRALRELPKELLVGKSKINMNSFLANRGIERAAALEEYHKSLVPNIDVVPKSNLVPIKDQNSDSSDLELEIIAKPSPKTHNQTTLLKVRNREMKKLAFVQTKERRTKEIQERKFELEELKRKKKERKEQRALKEEMRLAELHENKKEQENQTENQIEIQIETEIKILNQSPPKQSKIHLEYNPDSDMYFKAN
jgi:hypothetical protein